MRMFRRNRIDNQPSGEVALEVSRSDLEGLFISDSEAAVREAKRILGDEQSLPEIKLDTVTLLVRMVGIQEYGEYRDEAIELWRTAAEDPSPDVAKTASLLLQAFDRESTTT